MLKNISIIKCFLLFYYTVKVEINKSRRQQNNHSPGARIAATFPVLFFFLICCFWLRRQFPLCKVYLGRSSLRREIQASGLVLLKGRRGAAKRSSRLPAMYSEAPLVQAKFVSEHLNNCIAWLRQLQLVGQLRQLWAR